MMHILMTANATWNIWNFRRPVVDALLKAGHKITVLAPLDDSAADLENLGCTVLPLEMSVKGLNPLHDLKLIRRLRRIFRGQSPDVILSYTIKNNIFGALAAGRIPFVPNVTGLGTAFLSGGLLLAIAKTLYRRAFARVPVVFFQNENDRDLFFEHRLVRQDQARLLPGSGIDLRYFPQTDMPSEGEGPIFLMIARLLRDKGVYEFVEAAQQLKDQGVKARFQLLGAVGAQNRTAVDAPTVKTWQEAGLIEYLGTTNDVRPMIGAASCVVLPSYREGAPRALIEAGAMGRPVIATDVPGCRAVVDHGVTGFLCDVRSGDSLAQAMQMFLNHPPEVRAEMGQASRRKMEREYDTSLVIGAYQDVIAQLTNPR